MKNIKIKCPAKINLTLEVLGKRPDGFHEIKSIMQAICLFDILTISLKKASGIEIALSGTSDKIPYDSKNLVYKAAVKFLEAANITDTKITIHIEKNIPVEAGLAGGSTDAAGTFYGLNKLFDGILSSEKIEELCASLGSDLNFCLNGGTALCFGRGEKTIKLPTPSLDVSLIKPSGFGISAKEAYTKFSEMSDKSIPACSEKMIILLNSGSYDKTLLYNSLEKAVIDDYKELKEIKTKLPASLMSGSGPTFFVLDDKVRKDFNSEKFIVIENLKTTDTGVREV